MLRWFNQVCFRCIYIFHCCWDYLTHILLTVFMASTRDGKFRSSVNLLCKYLGDFLIASYLDVIQESGYNSAYVKEIEVRTVQMMFMRIWLNYYYWPKFFNFLNFTQISSISSALMFLVTLNNSYICVNRGTVEGNGLTIFKWSSLCNLRVKIQ